MSRGVYVQGGKCPGGYMSGGKCSGGTCLGGYVLEPTDISLNILNIN